MIEIPRFENTKYPLWNRVCYAKEHLERFQTQYCIVWEDPDEPDGPTRVTHPSPEWMAGCLNGGYVGPVDCYIRDREIEENWDEEKNGPFHWDKAGGASHPYAEPIGPMTEEECLEYQVQLLPRRVWDSETYRHNRPYFKICKRDQLPETRLWRDAWQMKLAA